MEHGGVKFSFVSSGLDSAVFDVVNFQGEEGIVEALFF